MATDGVPRAYLMPASRASDATLSNPTSAASDIVALFRDCSNA